MATLRWGIIGCGDVTEKKSGPAFSGTSQLEAVMRRDAEKARDYAKRHQVPKWYSTVEELLADPSVDAVYIATPPGSRIDIAKQVAEAGKPCYLEKPMARNFDESQQIADFFQAASLPLFVAYYRRAYPRFQRLKALLATLGDVCEVRYRLERPVTEASGWRHDVSVSGGGLFVDLGSHVLDLLDFLVGPLQRLQGVATRAAGKTGAAPEDVVAVSFLSKDQAVGTATWNFRSTTSSDTLEIFSSKAKVTVPDCLNGCEVITEFSDGSVDRWQEVPPVPVQLPMIQAVTAAILNPPNGRGSDAASSTGASALRTAMYMDQALESFYGGRGGAFWDAADRWEPNRVP